LLIALDPAERQHAGNVGYDDDAERVYHYDTNVQNSKRVAAGDVAVVRSATRLIGLARIERIVSDPGQTKTQHRCPSCESTNIKHRAAKAPRYRCSKCKAEFDQTATQLVEVTKFQAHFGSTFIAAPSAVSLPELRAACPKYASQLAMQEITLAPILPRLIGSLPALAVVREWLPEELLTQPTDGVDLGHELASASEFEADGLDARLRQLRAIAVRQGQVEFRQRLLDAYDRRCAITGCDAEDALEAAHIIPYQGAHTNDVRNGLLLRADLHTLFDRLLLTIDPGSMRVVLAPVLRPTSYGELEGRTIRLPAQRALRPSSVALARHRLATGF
jgi:ribosomal protein L37AE/L43A